MIVGALIVFVDRLEGLLNDLKPPPKWRHSALALLILKPVLVLAATRVTRMRSKKEAPHISRLRIKKRVNNSGSGFI